eukprot:gene3179-3650_t
MLANIGIILIITVSSVMSQGNTNPCSPFSTCAACITGGPLCSWCRDENFQATISGRPRCDLRTNLASICTNSSDPSSMQLPVAPQFNKTLGPKVQVSPQKVKLDLRPGQPATFEIKVKPAKDYPVDLYYLMDLSYSMNDDLDNLKNLGTQIATAIGGITKDYRLAFGSFVDKTVSPYIKVEQEYPCANCRKPFGFMHNLNFTSQDSVFADGVKAQKISGNLDKPEGGFDALMQLAVCEAKIGWRPKESARRIVIFVTDDAYHSAGDGKLGGIVIPNDGKCHLDAQNTYSMTNTLDYPSVSFLRTKLKESKIVPILAVTNTMKDLYTSLADVWKDLGTTVGTLSSDSSNVVNLVKDNYRKISSTIRLVDSKPADIKIKYKQINCKNKINDNECSGVANDEEVSFQVSVTALACTPAIKNTKSFQISIAGFGDITVETSVICDCECEKPPQAVLNSARCSNNGKYACGKCYCDQGRYGDICNCDNAVSADDSQCRKANSTSNYVCSKSGTCICGTCECFKRKNPKEVISGKHCECRNFGCDLHDGEQCGGPDHGICECNKCNCKGIWTGINCGTRNCTLVKRLCVKDGEICSGHGKCDCDKCVCDTGYQGTHCQDCPTCPNQCNTFNDCVNCQVFKKGLPGVCNNCTLLNIVHMNGSLPYSQRTCYAPDADGCHVAFTYGPDKVGNLTIWLNPTKKVCPVVRTKQPDILAIVLGIIGGLLLAAIVALLVWKLLVSSYDKYEYSKFEKERGKSDWNKAENPIYKQAKQKYDNPVYAGQR